jgi:hypothetical protein
MPLALVAPYAPCASSGWCVCDGRDAVASAQGGSDSRGAVRMVNPRCCACAWPAQRWNFLHGRDGYEMLAVHNLSDE